MELSYVNADALVRAIGGASGEHLGAFVGSLIGKQYSVSYVCQLAQHALAFGRWCEARDISLRALSVDDVVRYRSGNLTAVPQGPIVRIPMSRSPRVGLRPVRWARCKGDIVPGGT